MTHIYDYFHDAFGAEPLPSTKQCVKLKNMKKAELNWEEQPLPLLFLFLTAYELSLSPFSPLYLSLPFCLCFIYFIDRLGLRPVPISLFGPAPSLNFANSCALN